MYSAALTFGLHDKETSGFSSQVCDSIFFFVSFFFLTQFMNVMCSFQIKYHRLAYNKCSMGHLQFNYLVMPVTSGQW